MQILIAPIWYLNFFFNYKFIVKDNVGFGEWDWDILANEWDVQKLVEWGVDLPVFDLPIDEGQDDDNDADKEVCELCGK